VRNHVLTEAIGFVNALRFSPVRKISDTQVDQVLGFIGTNLYEVKAADLDKARDLLATVYGLTDLERCFLISPYYRCFLPDGLSGRSPAGLPVLNHLLRCVEELYMCSFSCPCRCVYRLQ
jgi:hypothetical protein